MDCTMTNAEFHEAWSNLTPHYAPPGYWDEINERRKKHRFVGRKAKIDGRILECIRAEDYLVIFRLSAGGELIISGDDVGEIQWI